jgi:Flp pilus assembly protein TadD
MQAILKQAQSCHQQGNFSEAESLYRQLHNAEPNNPLINSRLALVLSQTRRAHEALTFIIKALDVLPDNPDLLNQGVAISTSLAENKLSEQWLTKLIELKPDELVLQEQLCGVLIGNHQEQKALELSKAIIKQAPNSAIAYNLKGLALSRLGDVEKGYKSFQKALKLNPGQLAVIKNLLVYGKGKKEPLVDKLIPQLENKLITQNQAPAVKMNLAYVLSMYFEKMKNTTKSFHYLKLGNDINRSSYQYSHQQTCLQFQALTETFSASLKTEFESKKPEDKGLEGSAPIFILGMPRSGTTLVEQILSSHSLVDAQGEITDLKDNFEKHADILSDQLPLSEKVQKCLSVAQAYLDSVRDRQTASLFTDKMPYNFMLVGLIALALPNARIIHCTRDPLETCFSVYKQNFSGSHAYTNDLNELGQYYCEYQKMMAHWKHLFGEQIYEANYESMVADAETEITNLLAFCDLETEAPCFEFHKNKRAVRTASVSQVRQPIYKDALKASSPYKKQLQPLIEALKG